MTNKDEETRMLDELVEMPTRWFTEQPEKVARLIEWQFEIPLWYWNQDLVLKYHDVIRASGFDLCHYCGKWIEASRLVRVDMSTWYPSSAPMKCCESDCEIEVYRSR